MELKDHCRLQQAIDKIKVHGHWPENEKIINQGLKFCLFSPFLFFAQRLRRTKTDTHKARDKLEKEEIRGRKPKGPTTGGLKKDPLSILCMTLFKQSNFCAQPLINFEIPVLIRSLKSSNVELG